MAEDKLTFKQENAGTEETEAIFLPIAKSEEPSEADFPAFSVKEEPAAAVHEPPHSGPAVTKNVR
jgi:hypothetical protein